MAANPYTDPMTAPWLSPEQNQSMPGQAQAQPGQQSPLTYEQVQMALLGQSGYEEEMSDLEKQMMRANALRDLESPEGRHAGRVYVAANPLEHIGTGIKQWRGKQQAEMTEQEQADKREERRKSIGDITKFWSQGE